MNTMFSSWTDQLSRRLGTVTIGSVGHWVYTTLHPQNTIASYLGTIWLLGKNGSLNERI